MRTHWARTKRGFSLVELLTVIAIIALVISIIIPVLGGARQTGKRVATQGMLNDLSTGASQFRLDHRGRNPGYFSPKEMGSTDNATRGMSEMENVMLDLAGANAIVDGPGDGIVAVGPDPDEQIFVNPSLIGADEHAYFNPSREFYVAQLNSTGQQIASVSGHAGSSENDAQLLDVVDSFGQPILFWNADTYSVREITEPARFAAINSSATPPATFYWNTNAAFLKATNLGAKGMDMTQAPGGSTPASLLGVNIPEEDRLSTLAALLGSPSSPRAPEGQTVDGVLSSGSVSETDLFPGKPRGAFVAQSAGIDGVYLSTRDPGFSQAVHDGKYHLDYWMDFFVNPSTRVKDDQGNSSSRDVIGDFDDVVVSGG